MDVIGLRSAGVEEAVASCGTALTVEQVRAVRRHSERIVVNFDPDAAGANAAERSIQLLLDEGMHIRVLQLEGGLDPDEYVREHGAEVYGQRLEKAASYFHWLADRVRSRFDMHTAEGRMEGLKSLLPAIQRISDKLERNAVAADVAGYLGVDAGLVREQFQRSASARSSDGTRAEVSLPPVEQMLIWCLLRSPEARGTVLPRLEGIEALERSRARGVFRAMLQLQALGREWSYADLEARLDDADKTLLAALIFADQMEESDASLDQAIECLRALQHGNRRAQRAELKRRIQQAERDGNLEEAIRLMEELRRLERDSE
jgi:DNA primase